MITFNDINEALRKERVGPGGQEKNSMRLQQLPENFLSDVMDYFREKKEMSLKEEDTFSENAVKTKRQLENAMGIFRDLMRARKKKILELVFTATETGISKKDFDNMLDFEKELFENLMKSFENSEKKALEVLNGKREVNYENEKIIFKEDIGEFVNMDGKRIGPFKKDQIAELPKPISQILINSGKAEKVE